MTAVIGGREPSLVLESIARSLDAPLKRLAIEYNYIREGRDGATAAPAGICRYCRRRRLQGDIQFANAATAMAALEEISPRLDGAVRRPLRKDSSRCAWPGAFS